MRVLNCHESRIAHSVAAPLHILKYMCELLHVYRHDLDYDGLNYISLNVSLSANVNYTLLLSLCTAIVGAAITKIMAAKCEDSLFFLFDNLKV